MLRRHPLQRNRIIDTCDGRVCSVWEHVSSEQSRDQPRFPRQRKPTGRRRLQTACRSLALVGACLPALFGCAEPPRDDTGVQVRTAETGQDCEAPQVGEIVGRFGERLRQVSLLAPESLLVAEIRDAYTPLVTEDLISVWIARPSTAPGRHVSSPWPARIEVSSIEPIGPNQCRVIGEIIFASSADQNGAASAESQRVILEVTMDDGWQISAYQTDPPHEQGR